MAKEVPTKPAARSRRAAAGAMEWPGRPAWVVLGALALLLALAPPAQNAFWAVDPLRSLSPFMLVLVLLAAAAAGALAMAGPRARWARVAIPACVAGALALRFPEILHGLGDTFSRWGAIASYAHGAYTQPFAEWARALHAAPLDAALWLGLAGALTPAGASPGAGIALVSWLTGCLYFAGAWRLAARLDAGRGAAWGLWLALILSGGLLAFASYAESAGLNLALSVWFWAALLAPLDRPRRGAALAVTWLLAALAHRSALGLLLPAALRLLGPPLEGDAPAVRRNTAIFMLAAAAAVAAVGVAFGGGQLGSDLRELLQGPAQGAWSSLPSDLANLLVLLAPLALLAPVIAGRDTLARVLRERRTMPVLLGALVFLPLAFPLPVCGSGLGVHRDWDLAAPLGLALTVAAALVVSALPAARLRGALVATVPVLAIVAGGWVAVHHDPAASLARMEALLVTSPPLGPMQRSSALLFLGDHDLALGQSARAAGRLEESWRLLATPARGLHAVLAWVEAGEPDSAARVLEAVRAHAPLEGRNASDAAALAARIEALRAARQP